MKITAVNTYYVRPRWGFVEIETDEGYTGWGEAVLEGHADAVLACLNEYKPYLIGKDPSRIEDLSATIYRAGFYRGGGVMMSALSGIDQALWDIKGKYYNAPVYDLLGGNLRDKMRVYSWIGGDRPSDVARAAKEKQDAIEFKAEYDEKLKAVDKEAEQILSQTRKNAVKRENEIVDEAKAEAARIVDRANHDIELEKSKVKDDVKKEMVSVATVMAEKIVASSLDEEKQSQLIADTLEEMGEETWLS